MSSNSKASHGSSNRKSTNSIFSVIRNRDSQRDKDRERDREREAHTRNESQSDFSSSETASILSGGTQYSSNSRRLTHNNHLIQSFQQQPGQPFQEQLYHLPLQILLLLHTNPYQTQTHTSPYTSTSTINNHHHPHEQQQQQQQQSPYARKSSVYSISTLGSGKPSSIKQ
ncbi:hypothetical protein PP707_04215, partial [Acetobacter pasteurianus]|nr:hypothetical protein [Acetobacter pasteurianus]